MPQDSCGDLVILCYVPLHPFHISPLFYPNSAFDTLLYCHLILKTTENREPKANPGLAGSVGFF